MRDLTAAEIDATHAVACGRVPEECGPGPRRWSAAGRLTPIARRLGFWY